MNHHSYITHIRKQKKKEVFEINCIVLFEKFMYIPAITMMIYKYSKISNNKIFINYHHKYI